jgi:hypothetical protein
VRAVLGARLPAADGLTTDVEVSAFIWALKECVAFDAVARHGWPVARYEQLCAAPLAEFARLCAAVGLAFTPALAAAVQAQSTTDVDGAHSTSRQSARQADAWRTQLAAEDVARIRAVVERFPVPHELAW